MRRLFIYLLMLAAGRFYGEVRIKLRDGRVTGPIKVEQDFLEDTLPQPEECVRPAYEREVQEALKGVS